MASGLGVLARKEISEFFRSWRFPVLGGYLLVFAVMSPILAYLMPQIVSSMGIPGMDIELPPSTLADSYQQWIKNLGTGSLIVVIMGAGLLAGEISSGTATLVLTKPVPRWAFVLMKALSHSILVAVLTAGATAAVQGITLAVFGRAPARELWSAAGAWTAAAAWTICLETLLSALMPTLAAAGLGLLAIMLLPLANLWKDMERYSFTGMLSAADRLAKGERPDLLLPGLGLAGVCVLLLLAACLAFRRREI